MIIVAMEKGDDINMENLNLDTLLSDTSFISRKDVEKVDKQQIYRDLFEQSFYEDDKGRLKLNDGILSELYCKHEEMIYANGAFYCPDGMKKIGMVEKELQETIRQKLTVDIARNTKKTMDALKLIAYVDKFDFTDNFIIPFNNGDLHINTDKNWVFHHEGKQPVPYRLPIDFTPLYKNIPTPNFNKWLSDLFYPEDVATLQEYMGYSLLPTTIGQKILLIIGEGGCGKSIIKDILKPVFGEAMTAPMDLKEFFDDKFKIAELENQLVFYEDDINDAKLDDASKFKKLATGGLPITADRKFGQPFKFIPYCKFIMCGNSMLKCTSDKSDGFYRRLLPLPTKPKNTKRKDIKDFGSLVAAESDGILQWMLLGLKRLIDNGWNFTISDRSNEYLQDFRELSDHLPSFMADCFVADDDKDFTNEELRIAYSKWCTENDIKPLLNKTVKEWLFNNCGKYGLKMVNSSNIVREDKYKRGFKGGCFKEEYVESKSFFTIK